MKEELTEKEAEERYKEMLDETKEDWIKQYYGGDALKAVDPIAYGMRLLSYIDHLSEEYEIIE